MTRRDDNPQAQRILDGIVERRQAQIDALDWAGPALRERLRDLAADMGAFPVVGFSFERSLNLLRHAVEADRADSGRSS